MKNASCISHAWQSRGAPVHLTHRESTLAVVMVPGSNEMLGYDV